MKVPPILAVACFLCSLSCVAETRTFTNNEGKQIKAELVAVEDGKAVLKLANGRTASVPLASLSEGDQAHVKTWHEENKDKISERDLKLTIDKEVERMKADADAAGKKRGEVKGDTTETLYKCTLENLSSKTIEGLTANYTIHKRTSTKGADGSDTVTTEDNDAADVPKLGPKGTVEFVAGPAVCVDFEKRSKKGPGESQREKVLGIVITLLKDETEILKQSDPEAFLDRLEEEAERQKARDRGRE